MEKCAVNPLCVTRACRDRRAVSRVVFDVNDDDVDDVSHGGLPVLCLGATGSLAGPKVMRNNYLLNMLTKHDATTAIGKTSGVWGYIFIGAFDV